MTDSRSSDPTAPAEQTELLQFFKTINTHSPHVTALGMEMVGVARGVVEMETPFDEKFVGNPDTGVVHGGVITSILDHTSGLAVVSLFGKIVGMATLDLRIDYMKPSTAGKAIRSKAHCYKTTKNIAFIRAVAYHDSIDDPIATSVCTFMLTPSTPEESQPKTAGEGADHA